MRFIFFSSRICLLLKVFIINDQEIISKNSNIANEIHDSPIMAFSCTGQCFQDKSYRNQKSTQFKGFPNLDGSHYAMWIVVYMEVTIHCHKNKQEVCKKREQLQMMWKTLPVQPSPYWIGLKMAVLVNTWISYTKAEEFTSLLGLFELPIKP